MTLVCAINNKIVLVSLKHTNLSLALYYCDKHRFKCVTPHYLATPTL